MINCSRKSDVNTSPDPARALSWCRAHAGDIADSSFWRAFHQSPNGTERLLLLARWAERRPYQPLTPGGARTVVPENLHRLLVVAYLRGDLHAEDLPPVAKRWTFGAICDFAESANWPGWQDEDDLRGRYGKSKRRGDLAIHLAPPNLKQEIDRFTAGLASVSNLAVTLDTDAITPPGDTATAGRTRDGGGR